MPPALDETASDSLIGQPMNRREDGPLLTGRTSYIADIAPEDALHMAVLRSWYGHAKVTDISVEAAESLDGVVAAYTAAELERSGVNGSIDPGASLYGVDDPDVTTRLRKPLTAPKRPLLADEFVRYTGEPVAIVLAEDPYIAHDALDLLEVEYEPVDTVVDPERAIEADAPAVHEDVPDNVAFDWSVGDKDAVDKAMGTADRTIELEIDHQRISPMTMEPRGALSQYDSSSDELTVWIGHQDPHSVKEYFADLLGLSTDQLRIIAPDVGGGFGGKSKFYPAEPLTAWCAMQTGRPILWQATRTEAQRSDIHGRGRSVTAKLAIDNDGSIRGLRVESNANLGAYVSFAAPGTRTGSFIDVLSGQYTIPAIYCHVTGVFTNTTPIDSYRGSSRPMTMLTLERLMDKAAQKLSIDPADLRRRNFIPPESFPYETPVGETYDSGEYETTLEKALEMVDYEALRERQEAMRSDGCYLGIGICCTLDNAGTGSSESARIRIDESGTVFAYSGTADQGQGHRTTFAQLVGDLLGVEYDDVVVDEGDTADVPTGGGARGSRSVVMVGDSLRAAADRIIEQAKEIAASTMEASVDDVEFSGGEFHIRGAPKRSLHLQEVATLVGSEDVKGDVDTELEATEIRTPPATYPFGTHVAVVEVSPDTGDVDIERYVAVDDCGVPLNPKLVEGQIVGGVVQGIGQALYENAVYDDNGTLITGSLQDYAVPNADDVPDIETDHTVTPSPYNKLGVKGAGESGATAAPATVANAVADALEPFDIDHIDLPITPERVWRAIEDAS